ncbi:imelysin family protein [Arcobacter sp. 15-2]|uniref:imelysin family protein n=1 Tax=Arcobacter sp. 15-2 TaxID=3374109 RepID=UPI00399C669C
MIKNTKLIMTSLSLAAVMALTGCTANHAEPKKDEAKLLVAYANIATANYSKALQDAKLLQVAIERFTKNPTEMTLKNAKNAWLISRESYGETEIFRLANGPIDAEDGWVAEQYGSLEGQINAWPLDENMIDYTTNAKGVVTKGNIIDTKGLFNPGGEESTSVDVTNISVDAITDLNENGGDANVATGYHAIEFLLWGQDQDYSNFVKDSVTKGPLTAGQRPLSDYTTDKNKDRRKAYLNASAQKVVNDLTVIANAWAKDDSTNYRAALLGKNSDASKNISNKDAKKDIFAGMGVFIKSELANERIAVAVLTPSEEDEHSCFSDNTHRDIQTNYQGFKNILMGTYNGQDFGVAPIDALDEKSKNEILSLMAKIETKIESIDTIAKTSRHFDYQIRPNDPQAKVIVKLKNELRKLGDKMVMVASANGINLSIEDVTDAEETKL